MEEGRAIPINKIPVSASDYGDFEFTEVRVDAGSPGRLGLMVEAPGIVERYSLSLGCAARQRAGFAR
jgi:hypothetical protein